MRKKIIAGNWKMNLNWQEALELFTQLNSLNLDEISNKNTDIIIFPSALFVAKLTDVSVSNRIKFGIQNVHHAQKGAYTGEISLQQVKSIDGIKYVLVGHSERRQYFNETDQTVKQKIDACLINDFTPVICVGEPLEVRNKQQEIEYVTNQIKTSLFHLTDQQIKNCVIAYEPIWAIGTGKSASSEQAENMHETIRETIANHYSRDTAEQISILYGGSCTPDNAAELFACPNIDGGLIGGASLSRLSFMNIITICANS